MALRHILRNTTYGEGTDDLARASNALDSYSISLCSQFDRHACGYNQAGEADAETDEIFS